MHTPLALWPVALRLWVYISAISVAAIVSRHTVVCRTAQEVRAPHHEYINRKKENAIFTPLYLCDPLSDWNQMC